MAISNRRKQQLRHLGERVYIFKALQQDEDIWEKDEISQLLLTIADLDQEQEMIIDEINEIKTEDPPEDVCCGCQEEEDGATLTPEVSTETVSETVSEVKVETPEIKVEAPKKATASPAKTEEKPKPKTPRRRAAAKKPVVKKTTPGKSDANK